MAKDKDTKWNTHLTKTKQTEYTALLLDGVPVVKAAAKIGVRYSEIMKKMDSDEDFRAACRDALRLRHEQVLEIEKILFNSAATGQLEITNHLRAKRDQDGAVVYENNKPVLEMTGKTVRKLPPDVKAQEIILKAYFPDRYCQHVTVTTVTESPEDKKKELEKRLAELDS